MKTAKKHTIGVSLPTATSADHPWSPDHTTAAGMSGRNHAAVTPLSGHTVSIGGPNNRPSILVKPVGKAAVMKPVKATYKPQNRGGQVAK